MGIEITTKSVVTVWIPSADIEIKNSQKYDDCVVIRFIGYEVDTEVSFAELESAIKALKGEPTVGAIRKPGEIRVGDKVRVVRSDYYTHDFGKGAEGVVVSTNGSRIDALPGRPIVVRLSWYGDNTTSGFTEPSRRPYSAYVASELEVIEEAHA